MPELPEIELYKKNINTYLKGQYIKDTRIIREKSINLSKTLFNELVINVRFLEARRSGKFLILVLENEYYLVIHLMLDGFIHYFKDIFIPNEVPSGISLEDKLMEYGRPSIVLEFPSSWLVFYNLNLGYCHLLSKEELDSKLNSLGVDPLKEDFKEENLTRLLNNRKGKIKPWLMKQEYISGIGNAYSNEALYESGIMPDRGITSLSIEDVHKLYFSLRTVLTLAFEKGGYMDFPFTEGDTLTGGFNSFFKVYDRAGESCFTCGEEIKTQVIGGRNAFFCTVCQK